MTFTTASTQGRVPFSQHNLLKFYLFFFLGFWTWTFLGTTDRANWITENTLTVIFVGGVAFSHSKFKFSDLSYTFMFVYILLHIYGAMYTYAENPLYHFALQGRPKMRRYFFAGRSEEVVA